MKKTNLRNGYNALIEHKKAEKSRLRRASEEIREPLQKVLEEELPEEEKFVMDQKTIDYLEWIEDHNERKSKILDYLKENCMTPKKWEKIEHVTEYWVEWIRYNLTLPSVNWSDYKIISWFISAEEVTNKDYKSNETWKNNSSTPDDISTMLLWNMRDFLKIFGVPSDDGMNFTKELYEKGVSSDTLRSIRKITDLTNWYFLKEENSDTWNVLDCTRNNCNLFRSHNVLNAFKMQLLLWLRVTTKHI